MSTLLTFLKLELVAASLTVLALLSAVTVWRCKHATPLNLTLLCSTCTTESKSHRFLTLVLAFHCSRRLLFQKEMYARDNWASLWCKEYVVCHVSPVINDTIQTQTVRSVSCCDVVLRGSVNLLILSTDGRSAGRIVVIDGSLLAATDTGRCACRERGDGGWGTIDRQTVGLCMSTGDGVLRW